MYAAGAPGRNWAPAGAYRLSRQEPVWRPGPARGRVGGGMPPKYLVIVRRSEDALYAQLTSPSWQEAEITVIWDRRHGERRTTAPRAFGFRRRAERRRAPPD